MFFSLTSRSQLLSDTLPGFSVAIAIEKKLSTAPPPKKKSWHRVGAIFFYGRAGYAINATNFFYLGLNSQHKIWSLVHPAYVYYKKESASVWPSLNLYFYRKPTYCFAASDDSFLYFFTTAYGLNPTSQQCSRGIPGNAENER